MLKNNIFVLRISVTLKCWPGRKLLDSTKYINAYMHMYMNIYIQAYSIHTYISVYIHIHTYIHMYTHLTLYGPCIVINLCYKKQRQALSFEIFFPLNIPICF